MMERELSAFLAMVRRTSFVDYLQATGETAQSAFERRLSWARAHRNDPSHIDEAAFLLDNADSLRELVLAEVEESDWVEEASVGREFEARQPGRATSRPADRYTSMDDDLDEGSAAYPTEVQPRNGRRAPPSVTPATTIGRGQQPSRLSAHPSADFPYADNGRPQDPRATGRAGGGARSVAPEPQRVTVRPGPGRAPQGTPQTGRVGGAGVGALRRGPGEATPMARNPEPSRSAPRAQSRPPTPEERRPERGRSGASMAPQSADLPRPARGGGRAGFTPRSVTPSIPPFDRRGNLPPMSSGERTAAMAAPVEEIPSGIMQIEDFSGYQPHVFPPAGSGSADETVALPFAAIREAEARDLRGPPPVGGFVEPPAPNRLRRSTSNSEASQPRARSTTPPGAVRSTRNTASAPYPEYPELGTRPRTRWFARLVRATVVLTLLGGLAGGAVVGYPYLRQSGIVERVKVFVADGGDALLRQLEEAGDPGPAVSDPAAPPKAAEPEPLAAKEPAEAPASDALKVPSEDTRAAASIASAARAAEEPERAKATPASTDAARATSPAPRKAEPAPAPAAEEKLRSSAPAVDVQGLWVGSTMTGLSFKLTVLEQKGAAFEGTVEVQKEDSTFDSLSITGSVDAAGSMSFKGGGATFSGTVTSDRRRAVGTYKFAGGETVKWYAVH